MCISHLCSTSILSVYNDIITILVSINNNDIITIVVFLNNKFACFLLPFITVNVLWLCLVCLQIKLYCCTSHVMTLCAVLIQIVAQELIFSCIEILNKWILTVFQKTLHSRFSYICMLFYFKSESFEGLFHVLEIIFRSISLMSSSCEVDNDDSKTLMFPVSIKFVDIFHWVHWAPAKQIGTQLKLEMNIHTIVYYCVKGNGI